MGNPGGAGKGRVNTGTVRTQNRIRIDQRLERRDHMRHIEFIQFEIGGLPASVAYHNLNRPGGQAPQAFGGGSNS